MLKEVSRKLWRNLENALAPKPSKALETFNEVALQGEDPRISFFPRTQEVEIQCYGIIEKIGEVERIRILWTDYDKSYLVIIANGQISVFPEGYYRRKNLF